MLKLLMNQRIYVGETRRKQELFRFTGGCPKLYNPYEDNLSRSFKLYFTHLSFVSQVPPLTVYLIGKLHQTQSNL